MAQPQLPTGVHVLERGWLSANNIVFTNGVTAIVDTGYWSHQAQTVALVESLLGDAHLELLLNTHLHSDHCGGNSALVSRYSGARTLIPSGQSNHVLQWNPEALTYTPTGQHCPPFSFQGVLQNGDQVQMGRLLWQIHAAPGHDPHSIVLFEPTHGILMSADALWENGFGVVFPELEGESAFEEVGATIDLIQRLAPCIVIPGHGRVFTDLPSALERARRRLDGFVNNPTKHANHAAKVLIKFKLLEEQHVRSDDLIHWACATRYFAQLHEKYFSDLQQATWVQQIFDDLVRVGAARREDGWLLNC